VDPTIVAAVVGGVPAIVAAWFAYRASSNANAQTEETNRIAATKVDAEAYSRSQAFYEKLLTEADKHIDRLRSQVERLNDELDRVGAQAAQERDVANALRDQVRSLTRQVGAMEGTLAEMRRQMNEGRPHPA
jgi:septal ring factor EnvC (AmiA/AmiB activator)